MRHAQGSIFGPDYNVLTPLGREQAHRLGASWGTPVDHVFVGPAGRHQTTHQLARAALRGMDWPEAATLADLDEHDAKALVRGVVAAYGPKRPALLAAVADVGNTERSQAERSGAMQTVFEMVMRGWLDGTYAVDGVEDWPTFRRRVDRGLDHVIGTLDSGQHALVVSSVGPCAVALVRAGSMEPARAFSTAWRLLNTGVCRFLSHDGVVTLEAFNAVPHLPTSRLRTHR